MSRPRPEYPRPQLRREPWLNLNGTWDFAFDFGVSGEEKGWAEDASGFDLKITVPFCPESRLSGIEYRDFMPAVWYHRRFAVPGEWAGMRVFLRFGAVDYDCRAWVNGRLVGRHCGGSSSFGFEITDALRDGGNDLVVCARDDIRSGRQPAGKQSPTLHSQGVRYTRTTGIWQTVWLEAVPESFIEWMRIVPDLDGGRFVVTPTIEGGKRGLVFRAALLEDGAEVAKVEAPATSGGAVELTAKDPRPWSCGDPFLYGLRLELLEGDRIVDSVESYAGLRKFHIEGNRFFLNNEAIFLRFVLDQGFYPDGIWTAPSDAELKKDIERAKAVGFNGARLHQKVFEERFHYWADRLGYLTWGEFCDWGMDFGLPEAIQNHRREWREVVLRDLNHPSIVAWTPFNETYRAARDHSEAHARTLREVYELTKALDPTRPVNDASGYVHVRTDIFSVHNYEQDHEKFREHFAGVTPRGGEGAFVRFPELSAAYEGQPYVVDEYGGTWWVPEASGEDDGEEPEKSWGYGKRAGSVEEVYERIEKLTAVLTAHPHIAGFTYTQLTDVEQERNGIYTYDRKLKFDAKRLRKAFGAPAYANTPVKPEGEGGRRPTR